MNLDASEERANRAKQRGGGVFTTSQLACILLLSLAPWLPSLLLHLKLSTVRDKVKLSQASKEEVLYELTSALDRRRNLKQHVNMLEEHNNNLLATLRSHGDMIDPENNLYRNAEEKEETYVERIGELESEIKNWSKNRMEEMLSISRKNAQFEFTVTNGADDTTQTFFIQTLPLDDVPHSLAVFYEIIERQLFTGVQAKYDIGSSCLNLVPRAAETTASETLFQSILFSEVSPVLPSAEDINVWIIGRKDVQPLVSFCKGRSQRDKDEGVLKSFFGTVIKGESVFGVLDNPVSGDAWSVKSIRMLGDNH
ncbi:hypothetical protein ACA910_016785 [Epithemia clementina (nom. ined.)]